MATQAAAPSGVVLMPVGTDVSCEDMFADESDFEFDLENERALASATEAKQAQAVTLTARAGPLTAQAVPLTAQAVPLTAQAVALTAHTSKVLGYVRFLFGLVAYTADNLLLIYPEPSPDPTSFLIYLKYENKKIFFPHIFFL